METKILALVLLGCVTFSPGLYEHSVWGIKTPCLLLGVLLACILHTHFFALLPISKVHIFNLLCCIRMIRDCFIDQTSYYLAR